MQVPIRKSESRRVFEKPDHNMTEFKFLELKNKLERLKIRRPKLAAEVKRLAEMGDFSENAGYQLAKGQLRGLNNRLLEIENQLKFATIIKPAKNPTQVGLGNFVTLEVNGREKKFQILGSSETNPTQGVISHNSPLGSALIGRQISEVFKIKLPDREIEYKIIKIE